MAVVIMSNKTKEKDVITTVNPATGEKLKDYNLMKKEEVNQAIEACHKAFLDWKFVSPEDRAKIIKSIGKSLNDNKEELVEIMVQEMGKLKRQGNSEVELCVGICDYTAENGPDQLKDDERKLPDGGHGLISYSPIGVVYGIQPWNFPVYQVIRYTIANLMAGNGILLKHASSVTGSALLLSEIFKKGGLPENLFTVLLIDHDQSDAVIEHDLVRGVTLTGSPDAGTHIGKISGENLKKTVLELGSNDAYIVLEDADVDVAIKHCVMGRVFNNGETCVAAKRFIVVDKLYEQFKNGFVEKMKNLKYGDPTDDENDLGPMAREDLRDELHEQVQNSVKNGAKILCGGEIPDQKGFYYPATVLGNVKPGQPAYEDELFGPVASLIHAKDDEDAIRIANDSRFGLGGGIFSKDEKKLSN
nr:NAD-dependent succinate-semialdehyde dehydrogenase [Mangrovivirga cuniculi]